MFNKDLNMRLEVYNYMSDKNSYILVNPSDVSKHVKSCPDGCFPLIYVNSIGLIICSYQSGIFGYTSKTYNEIKGKVLS